jgi:hypothetical protein
VVLIDSATIHMYPVNILLFLFLLLFRGPSACVFNCGFDNRVPKNIKPSASHRFARQMMSCNISASCPQNLQTGSPSNRPIVRRCVLTGAWSVRIATTTLSWCLINFRSFSALFLRGPLIKSWSCLCPGTSLQWRWCWSIVQALISSLART